MRKMLSHTLFLVFLLSSSLAYATSDFLTGVVGTLRSESILVEAIPQYVTFDTGITFEVDPYYMIDLNDNFQLVIKEEVLVQNSVQTGVNIQVQLNWSENEAEAKVIEALKLLTYHIESFSSGSPNFIFKTVQFDFTPLMGLVNYFYFDVEKANATDFQDIIKKLLTAFKKPDLEITQNTSEYMDMAPEE